jgi:hypothetical protein
VASEFDAADIPRHSIALLVRWISRTAMRIGARLTAEARDLGVLTLPELCNNSRIRAFMDHVHEAFKSHQRTPSGQALLNAAVAPGSHRREAGQHPSRSR